MAVVAPFIQAQVFYSYRGTTQITWELNPHFVANVPWSFQVQVAEADNPAATWTNVGAPVSNTLITQVSDSPTTPRLPAGKEPIVFYRVQLTTSDSPPGVYYSPTASVFGNLPFFHWYRYQEIVRKENLRFSRLHVANQGYLLKMMRSGTPCPVCTDGPTQEDDDSQCVLCYGQRFLGGYYTAKANIYFDNAISANEPKLDIAQRGIVNDATVLTGRVVAFPYLSTYDVFVDLASDQRYYIRGTKTLAHLLMVPIISEVQLKLIPYDNVIYQFPVSLTD